MAVAIRYAFSFEGCEYVIQLFFLLMELFVGFRYVLLITIQARILPGVTANVRHYRGQRLMPDRT